LNHTDNATGEETMKAQQIKNILNANGIDYIYDDGFGEYAPKFVLDKKGVSIFASCSHDGWYIDGYGLFGISHFNIYSGDSDVEVIALIEKASVEAAENFTANHGKDDDSFYY
jgi:hypothetical protein